MQVTFNLSLSSSELRDFAVDIARRWTLNTIHDAIQHFNAIDPSLARMLVEIAKAGASLAASSPGRVPGGFGGPGVGYFRVQRPRGGPPGGRPPGAPPQAGPLDLESLFSRFMNKDGSQEGNPYPSPEEVFGGPPPGPPGPQKLDRCKHIEASAFQEEGWICHVCSVYNNLERTGCRSCGHQRCDAEESSEPDSSPRNSRPDIPSGSA